MYLRAVVVHVLEELLLAERRGAAASVSVKNAEESARVRGEGALGRERVLDLRVGGELRGVHRRQVTAVERGRRVRVEGGAQRGRQGGQWLRWDRVGGGELGAHCGGRGRNIAEKSNANERVKRAMKRVWSKCVNVTGYLSK